MHYSWIKVGIGVAVGLVAFALLLASMSYIYVSFLLLLVSGGLTAQIPKAAREQNATPYNATDLDDWREFFHGLRDAIPNVFAQVVVILVWEFAVRRHAFPADLPKQYGAWLVILALAVQWLMQVVAGYREGRDRRMSAIA